MKTDEEWEKEEFWIAFWFAAAVFFYMATPIAVAIVLALGQK